MIKILIDYFLKTNNFKKIKELINQNKKQISCFGLSLNNEFFFYLAFKNLIKEPLFIVTEEEKIESIYNNLNQWIGEKVDFLPKRQILPCKNYLKSNEIKIKRLKVIKKLIEGSIEFLILNEESLMDKYVLKSLFENKLLFLKKEKKINREIFIQSLIEIGYKKSLMVEDRGTFSVKGDIIDFFDPTLENPIRLDFFYNKIEKIKIFDKETQITIKEIEFIKIFPNTETPFLKEKNKNDFFYNINNNSKKNNILNFFQFEEEKIENILIKNHVSITEYCLKKPCLIFDEYDSLKTRQENFIKKWNELVNIEVEKKTLNLIYKDVYFKEDFKIRYKNNLKVDMMLFYDDKLNKLNNFVLWKSQQIFILKNRKKQFISYIKFLIYENKKIFIFIENKSKKNIIKTYFIKNKINCKNIYFIKGILIESFSFNSEDLIFINEEFIFGKKLFLNNFKKSKKNFNFNFLKIKKNDYVVHEEYGISKYDGIVQKNILGIKKDYLKLNFSGKGKLFIPVNMSFNIEKYIGIGEKKPKLSNLYNNEWKKIKEKAKIVANEIAKDLLKLYSKRKYSKGYSFRKDTLWQKNFEKKFQYKETEDQLKAIKEVKEDMENIIPMDRILIGDVGYGKTEIALRASFKASIEGKQVAILCPTTVLSQQHYNTFLKRFEDFPINISLLNRFVLKKNQKEIIKKIEKGKIDIIIGTHRILSKDIFFNDLGLLIIDEEQKFGVKDKEKIKQIKTNIDCLTLTATPIPRTLHMTLSGIKNLSIINTPPKERIPIETYVLPYNLNIIKESILKEIKRKGQVFYLYNKIKKIYKKKQILKNFIPEASFSIAHGKMSKNELEKTMLNFSEGKIDVLICTTLIENGLNIKNANTIIIENITQLGIAQLYQIRGRVGRSNKHSFAYFMFSDKNNLSEKTIRYLKTIKEFTENGSGFKIAMLDLEIRGAGNLLGKEQHGHIVSIGFDLYYKLLEDEILKLSGEKKTKEKLNIESVLLPIDFEGYIPEEYIKDPNIKLELYKKIFKIENKLQIENIKKEIIDRFGSMPKALKCLFDIIEIKLISKILKIEKIKKNTKNIMFVFKKNEDILKNIKNINTKNKEKINFIIKEKIIIYYRIEFVNITIVLNFLKFLKKIFFSFNNNI